ncbi:MAG: YeeE/YedE family protein [Burkholderiales bacterium]
MTAPDISSLYQQVLWASLGLSLMLGWVAQRSHFCTMGALGDIANMGDWSRMRMWVTAMAVAILGFGLMSWWGWLDATKSLYGGSRWLWLSALTGGLLFGFGMVIASGCGLKTLVRVGGGNLKSLVVFLVMGLAAYATLRGITGVLRAETVDQVAVVLPTGQDLPSLLALASGWSRPQCAGLLAVVLAAVLMIWVCSSPSGRERSVWGNGVLVGLIVVLAWWVSGRLGYVAEDPNTLEEAFLATNSKRMEALSFVAPVAYTLDWLLFFSDSARVLTLGVVSVVGVVLGSAASALTSRSFRWEAFRGVDDLASHLVGGVLMGVGGVTAMGCTVGQGLSGISTLSLGSFTALFGIMSGAWIALRWQRWKIEREL